MDVFYAVRDMHSVIKAHVWLAPLWQCQYVILPRAADFTVRGAASESRASWSMSIEASWTPDDGTE